MISPEDAISYATWAQQAAANIQQKSNDGEVAQLAKAVNFLAAVVVLLADEAGPRLRG